MNLSYKSRLQPTSEQVEVLEEQLNQCRSTYNTLLKHCYDERRAGRGTPTHKSLTYHLPTMKVETPELENVFSQVLQNVAKRVRYGFESYWARRRAGLKADTPHFRHVRDYNSLTYPQFGFKLDGSTLKLSKRARLNPFRFKSLVLASVQTRAGFVVPKSSRRWFCGGIQLVLVEASVMVCDTFGCCFSKQVSVHRINRKIR